jgi:hypothetical protein
MNELQRQHYLSALGVDTYMPRWHLPFAPISVLCELPVAEVEAPAFERLEIKTESPTAPTYSQPVSKAISSDVSPVNNLIGDMLDAKKVVRSAAVPVSAADILAQLDTKPVTIEPFSLSIWRPLDGVMIIDSRNTKLALPTELLLNNILRSVFSTQAIKPQEEVLRWPMIENSFAKRSKSDARTELQTWLSVQHEIRPIRYLWLMGSNAATYLLPEPVEYTANIFNKIALLDSAVNALVLPSLNELLQKPSSKQQLFSALRDYHSAQK